jgi:NTE family protein
MNIHVLTRGLSKIFGELSTSQAEEIIQLIGVQNLHAGDYLFHQGSKEKVLYIVIQGLFRSIQENNGTSRILGDIGISEPVGEFAFFSHEPRSASVIALRDSSVMKVDEVAYTLLSKHFPSFPIELTRYILARLKKNNIQTGAGGKPKNIALIKLDDEHDVEDYTSLIKAQFGEMGTSFCIYDHSSYKKEEVAALFDHMDDHDGLNFLICDESDPAWTQRAILYSDLIILGAEFKADPRIREIEKDYKLYSDDVLSKKVYLLLLHEEDDPEPTNTRRWFEGRKFDLHIHMRRFHVRDARRFCRILLHEAIGLVLGGGGAKGYAHAGALKAMMEESIEFDFVGGSSIGALVAIAITRSDFNLQEINNICREGSEHKVTSNDYDIPIISLLTGNKMRKYLKHFLGDVYIEDLWVTTFCVSTNFSAASVAIHDYGLARKYMEASAAIPGVFPPVIIDKQLHVDGGVMDNLPIEAMGTRPVKHIVAISLNSTNTREITRADIPSGRKLALSKLSGNKRTHLPGMTSLLINSLTLSSRQRQEVNKERASFYIELNMKGFGFLDWTRWEELIEKGYLLTKEQLDLMPEKEKFWVKELKPEVAELA